MTGIEAGPERNTEHWPPLHPSPTSNVGVLDRLRTGVGLLKLFFIQISTLVVVYEPKDILHLTGRHLGEA